MSTSTLVSTQAAAGLQPVGRKLWWPLLVAASMMLFLFLVPGEVPINTQDMEGDLGDAPDSTNHLGLNNTAYPGVLGHFPTVWQGLLPSGPFHANPDEVWLGTGASREADADLLPDVDGITNILNGSVDVADQDGSDRLWDDGWLNPQVPLPDCQMSTLKVRISKSGVSQVDQRLYLNVWFDGNRDGDWADVKLCANQDQRRAFEWIVQNRPIDPAALPADLLIPTFLVLNDVPGEPAWVRFTLSEKPAPTIPGSALADGRGPSVPDYYVLGETEDYLHEGTPQGEPGQVRIHKAVSAAVVNVGEVYTYSVHLYSTGGASTVTMVDELPAAVQFVAGPWVTEVVSTVVPLVATYDGSVGPSGAVKWHGTLSPLTALPAEVRIDYRVRVRECPDTGVIENVAEATLVDGTVITASTSVQVECIKPDGEITLVKHIRRPELEPGELWSVVPGGNIVYLLELSSTSTVTQVVHVKDDLPPGVIADWVSASSGVAAIVNSGHTVVWDGMLGPGNSPVRILIRTRLSREVRCEDELVNVAIWWTPFAEGASKPVIVAVTCHDLGDAPDSTNHYGVAAPVPMTAYPGVQAKYPTVYDIGPPDRGPLHRRPRPLHLGRLVSAELEADFGPDVDGVNNIIPPKDLANLDRADDGLELDKMNFQHCQVHRFPVWVSIDPTVLPLLQQTDRLAYLNVWLDGNRDGDWADLQKCPQAPAPEHIVIDHPVNVGALGPGLHRIGVTTTVPVYWPAGNLTAWLRVTLSEIKSNKTLGGGTYGDGRGYDAPFRLGETEDYLLRREEGRRPDLVAKKRVYLYPLQAIGQLGAGPLWHVGWVGEYKNGGAAPAHNVVIVDTWDTGPVSPVMTPTVGSLPPLTTTVTMHQAKFEAGTLLPGQGGHVFVRALLPLNTPPGTVVTNTIAITGSDDVDPSNNVHVVTATIPLLPPQIIYPRPGTICTDTFTITGRVQTVADPTTMDVDVYLDGTLHETVHPDASGRWQSGVSGLSDGTHEIWAVARYGALTSPPSPSVKVIVDSTLSWSPLSLRFVDQDGFVIWPRGSDGRMDETGWRVFLRANRTYTVSVYLCCAYPDRVTLQIGDQTVTLTDPDGDGWYEATFTTPSPMAATLRLCVLCGDILRCSDGTILIDPEGTVYDLETGTEVEGATVSCLEGLDDGSSTYYDLWPAGDYGQVNPQTTGADGYYSFFTPAGTYRVGVDKDGYQGHLSYDLVVVDEPVHYDVYLAPEIADEPDYTVEIGPLGFDPPVLVVEPGSVIEWVNVDAQPHASTSVTPTLPVSGTGIAALSSADAWDSGLLETGESYRQLVDTTGTYTYQDGENAMYSGYIYVRHAIYLPIIAR